ncbi:sodium-dependent bicarbonate transport family permease [Coralliovum pocilloporae]|uniref:sodium-dependent bicarbonate transport family permease n=1 Tax=Coralliovum pocilloporae TaxID=3066369 RepID=UPI0033079AFC
MDAILSMLAGNLLAPTILFFLLGLIAAVTRSDLSMPEGAAKIMSIYLLFAIGFKGGANLISNGLTWQTFATLGAGAALSFVIPFIAFFLLKLMTRLDDLNAAAVAGHYGSISIVTFVTATSLLELNGMEFEGYMVAVAAVMEVPAILSALWIAGSKGNATQSRKKLVRDIVGNGSIVLLVGSFIIGAITGKEGLQDLDPFIVVPFTGILCLFLLDMGLSAGRSILENRHYLTPGLFGFGCLMPLIAALLGFGMGSLVGLSDGGVFLLMVLAASASYIAVPAAMKIALPQAQSGIYLTMSLGVTFPFNIAIGIPLYLWIATL